MADGDVEIKIRAKDEASGVFDKIKHGLEEVKGKAGRHSLIGEGAETFLKGAGVVGGVALLGHELADVTDQAVELSKAFKLGEVSSDAMIQKIAEGVPLLGSFVRFFENVGELISGEEATKAIEIKRLTINRDLEQSLHDQLRIREQILDTHQHELLTSQQIKEDSAHVGDKGLDADLHRSAAKQNADIQATFDKELAAKRKHEQADRRKEEIADEQEALRKQYNLRGANQAAIREQIRKLEREAKTLEGAGDEEDQVKKDAADRRNAIAEAGNADRKEIEKQDGIDRAKQAAESEKSIGAIESEAKQRSLRESGKNLDAELEQIREAEKEKIEAAEQARDDAIRKNPEREKEIRERSGREIAAIKSSDTGAEAEAKRRDKNAQIKEQFDVESIQQQAKLDTLRAEASIGGINKKIELERTEIAEKYRQKRQEISTKLREDLSLSAEQKQKLNETLSGLDEQERKEKAIAAIKSFNFGLAKSDINSSDTGVASEFNVKLANLRGSFLHPNAAAGGAVPNFAGNTGNNPPVATAANTKKAADTLDASKKVQEETRDAVKALASAIASLVGTPVFGS